MDKIHKLVKGDRWGNDGNLESIQHNYCPSVFMFSLFGGVVDQDAHKSNAVGTPLELSHKLSHDKRERV